MHAHIQASGNRIFTLKETVEAIKPALDSLNGLLEAGYFKF